MEEKVFGLGFHKTGTSTLGECLKILGYNHVSWSVEAFVYFYLGEDESLFSFIEKYSSFEDWPWPLVYQKAFERYPNSKFILTTRLNSEIWFRSLVNHVKRGNGVFFPFRKYVYGKIDPLSNKSLYIDRYLSHNEKVRKFFSDKPDRFLEVCWERGDSWGCLCSFLGFEMLNERFPHVNSGSYR